MMNKNQFLSKYIQMFFQDYLICRRNLSGETIKSYRDVIKLFVQFAATRTKKIAAKLLVTDTNESVVVEFISYLEKKRGNSIGTQNHRIALIRRFWGYVSLQEPSLSEHCRKILDIPSRKGAELPEITYLEKDEIAQIFKVIDTNTALGRRDYAILLFMYNTGARVSETVNTRLSWLSLTKSSSKVNILGKGSKWRTCPLWPETTAVLQALIDSRKDNMRPEDHIFLNRFGNPISRFGITRIIAKYKAMAEIQMQQLKKKNVTPHTLRHSTAMHLLQSGVELNVIKSWLGHAHLSTTHGYVEIDLEMKREALNMCELPRKHGSKPRWLQNPDILGWLETL
jgi:site-specific recombinase XerD